MADSNSQPGGNKSFVIGASRNAAPQTQINNNSTSEYQSTNRRPVYRFEEEEPQQVRRSRGFSGEQAAPSVEYRIGLAIGTLLIFLGILLDIGEVAADAVGTLAAGVGVVIGYAVDFGKLVVIPATFLIFRVPFWKGKKATKKVMSLLTTWGVGAIPWLGAILPETAIGIAITIYLTRAEDREKVGETSISDKIVRSKRVREKISRISK